MDIRLIAMDLDGTALCKDRCSFSPRLKAACSHDVPQPFQTGHGSALAQGRFRI